MMKKYICTNKECGMEYSKPTKTCTWCFHDVEEVNVPDEEVSIITKGSNAATEQKTTMGAWYTFAHVMVVLQIIAAVIMVLVSVNSRDYEYIPYAIGCVLSMPIWGVVILLSKIEQNTRK